MICHSQTIDIAFPQKVNVDYVLIGYKGEGRVILSSGKTDSLGIIKVDLSDIAYRGMSKLYFAGESGADIIISGNDVRVSEQEGIVYFSDEENNLVLQYLSGNIRFEDVKDGFYAKSIIGIYTLMQKAIIAKTIEGRDNLKTAFVTDLDVDGLYTSGMWTDVMSMMFSLFKVDKQQFNKVVTSLLEKTESKDSYEDLVKYLIRHCEELGWEDTERMILDYYETYANNHGYSKKMEVFRNLALRKVGSIAPDLSELAIPHKNTILFFYSSNCGNCKEEISALISNYSDLSKKGFDVVSISADESKRIYEKYSANFPWKHKLCDFKGISGNDFVQYGILGTPTLYLIDEEGKIVGRFAGISEIENHIL